MLLPLLLVAATAPASWQVAIDAYRDALAAAQRGGSIERLFERAADVKAALQPVGESTAAFEALTDSEIAALQARLPGIILNKYEVILTEPDPRFFHDLAQKHGRADDAAFFKEYILTYPDSVWASYVSQVTDVTACTDFGRGELVARYAGWLRYRRVHRAYRQYADREIARIEEQIGSTCACQGRESVIREMTEFARRFPNSPATPAAKKQLRDLRRGTSPMRFHCAPA